METLDFLHKDKRLHVNLESVSALLYARIPLTANLWEGPSILRNLQGSEFILPWDLASCLINFFIKECLLMFNTGLHLLPQLFQNSDTQVAISYLFCKPLGATMSYLSILLELIIAAPSYFSVFLGAQTKPALEFSFVKFLLGIFKILPIFLYQVRDVDFSSN